MPQLCQGEAHASDFTSFCGTVRWQGLKGLAVLPNIKTTIPEVRNTCSKACCVPIVSQGHTGVQRGTRATDWQRTALIKGQVRTSGNNHCLWSDPAPRPATCMGVCFCDPKSLDSK